TTMMNPQIKSIFLFAPGFKPQQWLANLVFLVNRLRFFSDKLTWYRIRPQISYARYYSFPVYCGTQVLSLMHETRALLKTHRITMPMFMALTEQDETIDSAAAAQFFIAQKNPLNRLLYYSNKPIRLQDSRITYKNS